MPGTEQTPPNDADLKEFLLVVRQALLQVVYWIEARYKLEPPNHYRNYFESRYGRRLTN